LAEEDRQVSPEPRPPDSFAAAPPGITRSLHEMNAANMIFEIQGTLGEVKQAVQTLTTLVQQGEARLNIAEADVREVKGIMQRLEPILTRLDDRTRKIDSDTLPKFGTDLAELKGRVSQLPTALTIFAYMGSLVALTVVLFGAAYGVLKFVAH